MTVTRSQGGTSLAQLYDTLGTALASNADLEGGSIHLVHEMGALLFSEGLTLSVRHLETLAVAQSTAFNVVIGDLPRGTAYRILNCIVFMSVGDPVADLAQVALLQRDPASGREIPFFSWENDNGSTMLMDNGAGPLNHNVLNRDTRVNYVGDLPLLGNGTRGGVRVGGVSDIAMRGTTAAFGAGTTGIQANIIIAHTDSPGAIRTEGLRLPSW